jgi:arylsulfatase A-like enzyme
MRFTKSITLFLFCTIGLITLSEAKENQPPNIVFILSDDQAWNGLSMRMHPDLDWSASDFVHTPNIARLAKQGMRFSNAYSPSSVCSPTRISLQTGKSPAQLQWTKAAPTMTADQGYKLIPPTINKNIDQKEVTVAELLKTVGFATAHYGKWHIGGGGPGEHGYDEHDGNTGNKDAAPHKDPNPVDIFGMSRRAIAFMKKQKATKKPFFIQLSYHALHYPQNALEATKKEYQGRGNRRNEKEVLRGAIAENLDTGVGMLLEAITELKLAENTYVIYMSDNGSGGGKNRNNSLRGGKGGVWEGGIRVPLIVRGPSIKANTFCHTRVVGYDLFPTFCEWGGVKHPLPKNLEGGSIVPLLATGEGTVKRLRKELVFHFPHYQSSDGPQTAILAGNFKLLRFYESGKESLFHLGNDITERNDLVAQLPDKAKELSGQLDAYLKGVNARVPVVNPKYNPNSPPAPPRGKKGQGRKRGAKKK